MTGRYARQDREKNIGRQDLEKNISTEQHFPEKNTRVQAAHENKVRPTGSEKKAGQGQEEPLRLTGHLKDPGFPKAMHLRSRQDYLRVQKTGRAKRGQLLILIALENGLPSSRFGLTVSGRLGNAVKRNKVRRRIREIQRINRHVIKPGYDIIAVARIQAGPADFSEIEKEFLVLAKDLGLTA